jgi:hypothetical protein
MLQDLFHFVANGKETLDRQDFLIAYYTVFGYYPCFSISNHIPFKEFIEYMKPINIIRNMFVELDHGKGYLEECDLGHIKGIPFLFRNQGSDRIMYRQFQMIMEQS